MKFSQLIYFDADKKIENMNNQLCSPIETCRMNPGKSLYLLIQKGVTGEFNSQCLKNHKGANQTFYDLYEQCLILTQNLKLTFININVKRKFY